MKFTTRTGSYGEQSQTRLVHEAVVMHGEEARRERDALARAPGRVPRREPGLAAAQEVGHGRLRRRRRVVRVGGVGIRGGDRGVRVVRVVVIIIIIVALDDASLPRGCDRRRGRGAAPAPRLRDEIVVRRQRARGRASRVVIRHLLRRAHAAHAHRGGARTRPRFNAARVLRRDRAPNLRRARGVVRRRLQRVVKH